jgi:hypothetical protein
VKVEKGLKVETQLESEECTREVVEQEWNSG